MLAHPAVPQAAAFLKAKLEFPPASSLGETILPCSTAVWEGLLFPVAVRKDSAVPR